MENAESKPFLEHLEDLRWTLFKVAGAIASQVIIAFWYTEQIIAILTWPLRKIGKDPHHFFYVMGVIDPFSIQIDLCLFFGIILALPAVLYFIGQFLLPALTPREKGLLLPTFTAGALLFLVGCVFCYFVLLPQTLSFFLNYSQELGFEARWTMQNYLDFALQMILSFGVSFELPLVIVLLNKFGIVSNAFLRSKRRHAFVIIFILACCIMPTSDAVSLGMLAGPMYLLYEVTIWITLYMEKKKASERLAAGNQS